VETVKETVEGVGERMRRVWVGGAVRRARTARTMAVACWLCSRLELGKEESVATAAVGEG
jgi:hypothetical protein